MQSGPGGLGVVERHDVSGGEGVAMDVSLALGVTVGNANGGETNRLGETDVNGDVAGDGLGDGFGLGDGVGVGGGP